MKRAFSIQKPSLPDQFTCLKCADSWVPDPTALTLLKPWSIVIITIMIIIMRPFFTYAFIRIVKGIHILVLKKVLFQDLSILTVSL